jgi:maltooligosyltrehalose synthase
MTTDELKKLVEAVSEDWTVGEYDGTGGYDCMTGAIMVGHLCLDGANYGQEPCQQITETTLTRMTADAQLAGLSPALARKVIALREAAERLYSCAAVANQQGLVSRSVQFDLAKALATLRAVLGENE